MPKFLALLVVLPLALYGLHRLALWMERRGWIYYKTSGTSSTRTNAFLALQSLIEPSKQYVLEERIRQQDELDQDQSGDPPATDPEDEKS